MVTCYPDSKDYSTLTDPKLVNAERQGIKEALRELARAGHVRIVFSAAAVCESVALAH